MKKLIIINGTMGVGKTTVSNLLSTQLPNSVFLDGDWCWQMHPFILTEETKQMVLKNIIYLLSNFLTCSVYQHIIFCWVIPAQEILDEILRALPLQSVSVYPFTLSCSVTTLEKRLSEDIAAQKRSPGVLQRSKANLPQYQQMNTMKIDTDFFTPQEIVQQILQKI